MLSLERKRIESCFKKIKNKIKIRGEIKNVFDVEDEEEEEKDVVVWVKLNG